MVFNSIAFFVFLPLVLAVYWRVPPAWRNGVLLVASYVFYGWWDWRFLSLLVISTAVDFVVAHQMHSTSDERRRLRLLLISITVNLGILGVFKYANFFSDGLADVLNSVGLEADSITLDVLLPVGISFYTFQTLSYTFDVYRRRIEPTHSIIDFGTYVAYFPQLVAGPIERAHRLMPQIVNTDRPRPTGERMEQGLILILTGLVKKVVLADGVARVANTTFGAPDEWSWIALTAGVIAFAIQIYGDFSGYTDIARGVSMLLGIDLVLNFTEPYLSRNITEFWRRWHISLSDWLRDYLYIPLGGNRGSKFALYRNLMITMLLGGLWHGASWNFVIWGGLHGAFLVVHKLTMGGQVASDNPRLRDVPAIALTNLAVLFTWIFFRAQTLGESWDFIRGLLTLQQGQTSKSDLFLVAAIGAATAALDLTQRRRVERSRPPHQLTSPVRIGAGTGVALVAVLIFSGGVPTPFIYFQF